MRLLLAEFFEVLDLPFEIGYLCALRVFQALLMFDERYVLLEVLGLDGTFAVVLPFPAKNDLLLLVLQPLDGVAEFHLVDFVEPLLLLDLDVTLDFNSIEFQILHELLVQPIY